MQIRFWGTRGSIARPSAETLGFGGNTSCIEISADDGTLVVLDCGTGAWELGRQLLSEGPRRGHLLIGHTHWDHIQGFPFFGPLFARGWTWDVYAPGGLGPELEHSLGGQMSYEYFPITLEALSAWLRYHDLMEGELELGGIRVKTRYLNHPAVTLGYRLKSGGRSVVYAADHEPHSSAPVPPGHIWEPKHREDRRHIDFLAGADLVIHDTQYTEAEYAKRIGWGHTPIERAVDACMHAGVKQLALFHHDPARTDEALRKIVEECNERVDRHGSKLKVFAAAERQAVTLDEQVPRTRSHAYATTSALQRIQIASSEDEVQSALVQTRIDPDKVHLVVADPDPEMLSTIKTALKKDGYHLTCFSDGKALQAHIVKEKPVVVLVDRELPGLSSLELCKMLRQHDDPHLARMPLVLMSGETDLGKLEDSFAAGVTDCLLKPFKPAYLRARVRGWLLRADRPT
jgi:phosphoribosyl 1,2-cyclic phosphodiesterase